MAEFKHINYLYTLYLVALVCTSDTWYPVAAVVTPDFSYIQRILVMSYSPTPAPNGDSINPTPGQFLSATMLLNYTSKYLPISEVPNSKLMEGGSDSHGNIRSPLLLTEAGRARPTSPRRRSHGFSVHLWTAASHITVRDPRISPIPGCCIIIKYQLLTEDTSDYCSSTSLLSEICGAHSTSPRRSSNVAPLLIMSSIFASCKPMGTSGACHTFPSTSALCELTEMGSAHHTCHPILTEDITDDHQRNKSAAPEPFVCPITTRLALDYMGLAMKQPGQQQ